MSAPANPSAGAAETSEAGTITRVHTVTDMDPDMPFGIPAGEVG